MFWKKHILVLITVLNTTCTHSEYCIKCRVCALYRVFFSETGKNRIRIDIRNPLSLKLSGFDPERRNVFIVHGFNGTESKTPMTILRDGKRIVLEFFKF